MGASSNAPSNARMSQPPMKATLPIGGENGGETERFIRELMHHHDKNVNNDNSLDQNTDVDVHWWKSQHRESMERDWIDANNNPSQLLRSTMCLLLQWNVTAEKATLLAGSTVLDERNEEVDSMSVENEIVIPPSRAVIRLVQLLCTPRSRINDGSEGSIRGNGR
eukprot:3761348-Ditylum_brightwellii.AAC.1